MKNIVFDLGGVLFNRHRGECTQEFIDFFDFIRAPKMPEFWEEYDRGALTLDQVKQVLCGINDCSREQCDLFIDQAIDLQRAVVPTEELIRDLKAAGYKLYVLSNMSKEFIAHLRTFPVYELFDGEVVSCEEQTVKPEPRIYEILLGRYGLDPAETIFIDDRPENLEAAACFGIATQLFDRRNPDATCSTLRQGLL